MSSITAKILTKLNTADFNVGILSSDAESRSALMKIQASDIDTLIDNLDQLRTYVADIQENKQATARKLLESLVSESSDFSSVEELLSVLGTNAPVTAGSRTTSSKPNGNKSYDVVLFDQGKDEHRTYTVTNKILPKALVKDDVYQALIKKNKELTDIDSFLRAYSEDYAKQYPINAKYKKDTFHLNSKGRLNAQSAKYFEVWKKEYPNGDEKDFKEQVMKEYKTV